MKIVILTFISLLLFIGCCKNNNNKKCNETFCENGIVKINICTRYQSVQPVINPMTQKVIMCEEEKINQENK